MLNAYLDIQPEVAAALAAGKPVVALESTIISHGMPYPQNVETARQVEQVVRDNGAVPATIAILDGRLKVGLDAGALEALGRAGHAATKCSRRDIPFVLANKGLGATTVASTMIIAAMAGIRVFATGGIGGVHRGAATTMDISADLLELARTPVAVVCAGAKSILDLGLTLEYLETHGVPVLGYQTDACIDATHTDILESLHRRRWRMAFDIPHDAIENRQVDTQHILPRLPRLARHACRDHHQLRPLQHVGLGPAVNPRIGPSLDRRLPHIQRLALRQLALHIDQHQLTAELIPGDDLRRRLAHHAGTHD